MDEFDRLLIELHEAYEAFENAPLSSVAAMTAEYDRLRKVLHELADAFPLATAGRVLRCGRYELQSSTAQLKAKL